MEIIGLSRWNPDNLADLRLILGFLGITAGWIAFFTFITLSAYDDTMVFDIFIVAFCIIIIKLNLSS